MSALPADLRGQEWRFTPSGYGWKLSRGAWLPARHLTLLSQKLVETSFGVNRGRLIVTMPPRHGKSEHSSHYGPVWYLDMFPERHFGIATYGAEFSSKWGSDVRSTIEEHGSDLRVRISKSTRSKSNMSTLSGGGLYTVGVGGQLTGRGVHGLGIDDPHKDYEQAHSVTYRERVWNWYLSTARTRLNSVPKGQPRSFVVVTMTRWHEDDLVGKLLAEQGRVEDGGLWEVVNLPAIAVDDDPLGRKPGEALWPERVPLDGDDGLLATKDEVGDYVFEALYQQNPTPPAGSILLRRWWKTYEAPPHAFAQTLDYVVQSWDMAFKDSDGSDFVCGQVWGVKGSNRYLLDIVCDRWSFVETVDQVRALKHAWPKSTAIYVEDAANGPAVISTLKDEIPGIVPVTPVGSKESRAHAQTPYLKAGNIWIPTAANLPGVKDFVDECAIFPKGKNDDRVDAFTQAMLQTGFGADSIVMGGYRPNSGTRR